jgi:Undecaprenyl-phosphate galactose phosphotransferase WbaP
MERIYETTTTMEAVKPSIKALPMLGIRPYSRVFMTIWLMSGDLLALAIAGFLAIQVRTWLGGNFAPGNYYALASRLMYFMIGYALVGLYPGVGMNPIQEIKRLSQASSFIFISMTTVLFLAQSGLYYSRLVLLLFWMFTIIIVPIGRIFARKLGVIYHIFGEPVALIGFGAQGKHIYKYIRDNPTYGIKPVVVVNGSENEAEEGAGVGPETVEIPMSELERDHLLLSRAGIRTAILAPNEIPQDLQKSLVDEQEFGLNRLILISSLNWIGDAAVVPHDLGGILGLEVERNLLRWQDQMVKRVLDMFILFFACLVGFPLMMLYAGLIWLDTPGPIFFKHRRVGKGGKPIEVWKFRTMVYNADEILENYLCANPELRVEWEATHKLKNDPRVTRVGKLLRKTSMDELPQLINVLKGEMSLVGPRPIVQKEIRFYKDGYRLYTQVLPGVSGLWQVSGRSDASYGDRVSLDEYYIRHWSIWMDIYILIRTVWVVVKRSGAY